MTLNVEVVRTSVMAGYGKTWLMTGITIGLAVTAVLLFTITFWYAETTKDPDAIEAPVFFLSVGLLLLAGFMLPVSIGVWRFEKNRHERARTYSDY